MSLIDQHFVYRLIKSGIDKNVIPGFIRSFANALLIDPSMNHTQLNQRLKFLGWDDVEIDYHTFQLAISSLETKGLSTLRYKHSPFYVDGYKNCHSSKALNTN